MSARLFIPAALRIFRGNCRLAVGHRRRARNGTEATPHRFAGDTTIEEKE
jgi:hypothetical protein